MSRLSLLKSTFAAAGLAFGVTAAVITPTPAEAGVSPAVLGQTPTLAPMLKEVLPAVVNISVTAKVEIHNPLLSDPFFRQFFDIPDRPQTQEMQSVGSGVIVDAGKGYVLTNHHVVAQADSIRVKLKDDREFDAKLIGSDPNTDIAVLQIKGGGLKALTVTDSDALQVGDFVVAVGNPFGLGQTVTSGIVSALGRSTEMGDGSYQDFIQTDASINPGNSGGALVNLKGELVGINSQILSGSGGNIGIGFAIPSNMAKVVMQQIIEHGSVQRGRIGIVGQNLTPDLAKAFGIAGQHGVVVSQVVPKSPADKAGIKPEDIILAANGKDVRDMQQLRNQIGLMRIGDKVEFKLLHEGKPRTVSVIIGKETEDSLAASDLHPRLAGASFGAISEGHPLAGEVQGVLVQDVKRASPAARAGLRKNDIIVAVNRVPVGTLAQFGELMKATRGGELLLHIRRGNGALFLVIQ